MKYNQLGKTGMMVSEIGLGCEHLEGKDYSVVKETIDQAISYGINLFDVFMSEPNIRSNIGKALKGRRNEVYIQGHLRAIWKDNQYCKTLDIDEVTFFFDDLMQRLGTDYIDIGMLHIMDSDTDFNTVFNGDILKYALELKEKGVIRALGISSHNPVTALKAVKTGLIDVLFFSINPVYDMLDENAARPKSLNADFFNAIDVSGINSTRNELYKTCEAMGIGITVMKSLAAGALLDSRRSPFGVAMTVPQCIHYALNRPAATSVLVGLKSAEEMHEALAYETVSNEEKDYSAILSTLPKFSLRGHCMYCNHCLPCTAHIDIAEVNKYLDLALMQPTVPNSVKEHYNSLEVTAKSCVGCGACEKNCPFQVSIMEKMKKAVSIFGK